MKPKLNLLAINDVTGEDPVRLCEHALRVLS
jgi:hypothetical protein